MPDTRTIGVYLSELVADAARAAVAAGDLPDVVLPAATVERPKDAANGDFASTLPMRLARSAMKPPLDVARAIAKHIPADAAIEPAEVAPPGFINLRLSNQFVQSQVEHIIRAGPGFADLER